MSDPRPIGVFDSGVGGLTVLREILRRSPHESTIYLGDNARAPYGVRSDDEVRRFSMEALDELAERDVKALVVACNTSTAVALRDLRVRYDLPVLGVVRPGAAAAALATRNRRVGVIATPATVRSHAYFNAIKDENPAVEVYEHATPRFVPMVEAGTLSGAELEAVVKEELAPLLGERDGAGEFVFPRPPSAKIDTLLLGCTHYPLLRPILTAAVGDRVAIVDSATATAATLAELLSVNGLETPGTTRGTAADPGAAGHSRPAETYGAPPTHVQLTTGDVERFRAIASRMFGEAFPDVDAVELRSIEPGSTGAGGLGAGGLGLMPAAEPPRRRGGRISDDRLWQVGFVVGSVLGAAVTVAGRHLERNARYAGLVDWRRVEDIAIARLRTAPGALSEAELRAVEADYAAAMARVVPALSAHLETDLPGVVDRVAVVDRAGWVRANTSAFAGLIGRLEDGLLEQMLPPGAGMAKATLTYANRWVTTRQMGLLLGFMGQRVQGQYDITLLTAETTPGRLLFVEENIRHTAKVMDVPLGPFRTWIALHETTHAFEFEAHPWLRPYLAERLERQLALFSADARTMGNDAMRAIGASLRGGGRGDDQHWMERLMSDEQRRLFRETQAVMALLEGYGDHVMDTVGKDLVPGVERISARFHGRREQRTPFERAMLRITGMDLKMEQYRKGELFVAGIERLAGAAALRRLWDGPETMPTPEEIDRPADWVRRMGLNRLEGGTR